MITYHILKSVLHMHISSKTSIWHTQFVFLSVISYLFVYCSFSEFCLELTTSANGQTYCVYLYIHVSFLLSIDYNFPLNVFNGYSRIIHNSSDK